MAADVAVNSLLASILLLLGASEERQFEGAYQPSGRAPPQKLFVATAPSNLSRRTLAKHNDIMQPS